MCHLQKRTDVVFVETLIIHTNLFFGVECAGKDTADAVFCIREPARNACKNGVHESSGAFV